MDTIGFDLHERESQLFIIRADGTMTVVTSRDRLTAVLGDRPLARIMPEASTESECAPLTRGAPPPHCRRHLSNATSGSRLTVLSADEQVTEAPCARDDVAARSRRWEVTSRIGMKPVDVEE